MINFWIGCWRKRDDARTQDVESAATYCTTHSCEGKVTLCEEHQLSKTLKQMWGWGDVWVRVHCLMNKGKLFVSCILHQVPLRERFVNFSLLGSIEKNESWSLNWCSRTSELAKISHIVMLIYHTLCHPSFYWNFYKTPLVICYLVQCQ